MVYRDNHTPGLRRNPHSDAEKVAASDLAAEVMDVQIAVVGGDAVEVRLVVHVDYVFAKAIPGAADGTSVTAAASAAALP